MQKFKLKFASFFRQLPEETVHSFRKMWRKPPILGVSTVLRDRTNLVLLYKI